MSKKEDGALACYQILDKGTSRPTPFPPKYRRRRRRRRLPHRGWGNGFVYAALRSAQKNSPVTRWLLRLEYARCEEGKKKTTKKTEGKEGEGRVHTK